MNITRQQGILQSYQRKDRHLYRQAKKDIVINNRLQRQNFIQQNQLLKNFKIQASQDTDNYGTSLLSPEDVTAGGIYDGYVERIERYGLFINIGLRRPGLVHISEISNDFISAEQLVEQYPIGTSVQVLVVSQDRVKGNMELSIKRADPSFQERQPGQQGPPRNGAGGARPPRRQGGPQQDNFRIPPTFGVGDIKAGQEVQGVVVGQIEVGYFISFGCQKDGLLLNRYVEDQELNIGDPITAYVQYVNTSKEQVRLQLTPKEDRGPRREREGDEDDEDGRPSRKKGGYKRESSTSAVDTAENPAQDKFSPNQKVKGIISRIFDDSVIVNVEEGYRFKLSKDDTGVDESEAESFFKTGNTIEAYVLQAEGDLVDLTLQSAEERQQEQEVLSQALQTPAKQEADKKPGRSGFARILASKGLKSRKKDPEKEPTLVEEKQMDYQQDEDTKQAQVEQEESKELGSEEQPKDAKLMSEQVQALGDTKQQDAQQQLDEGEQKQVEAQQQKDQTQDEALKEADAMREVEKKQVEEQKQAEAKKQEEIKAQETAKQVDDDALKTMEANKQEEEKKQAEEKKRAEAKKEQEQKEAEALKKVKAQKEEEEQKQAEEKKQAEAIKQEEEQKQAEALKQAEVKKQEEEQKLAEEKKQAEAKKQEEQKQAEAKRQAEAQQQAEAQKQAEIKQQAEQQKAEKQAEEQKQSEPKAQPAAQQSESQEAVPSNGEAHGVIAQYVHGGNFKGSLVEVRCESEGVANNPEFIEFANKAALQVIAYPVTVCVSADDVPKDVIEKEKEIELQRDDIKTKPENMREKIVMGRLQKLKKTYALLEQPYLEDNNITIAKTFQDAKKQFGEDISIRRFERFNLGEGLEKKSDDFASEVAKQTEQAAPAEEKSKEEKPKAEAPQGELEKPDPNLKIPAKQVGELRSITQAGMSDCKKALQAVGGDMTRAQDWLRKKGITSAQKKASRIATEGAVYTHVENNKYGIIIEVNCETDFVSKGDAFREFTKNVALTAISPAIQYVSLEEVPKQLAEQKGDSAKELCLLNAPYNVDSSKTVEEAIKETIAKIGENIKVRRFVKYQVGETL